MLSRINFTKENILGLRENRRIDPMLLERTVYAFGLLEALVRVGMPFIFKGGTSLMLLLEHPRRLSTDIDIIVEPGSDVDKYFEEAAEIFPFFGREEQSRKGKNQIVKRHFKFAYNSPVSGRLFNILLDVLFEENHYSRLIQRNIDNELLITEDPYLPVTVPSADCILGDKLTAFAPHTTGIPFGVDKELEIIKQMYDVASLTDICRSITDVRKSYLATVKSELQYRGLSVKPEDVLQDTIDAAVCVASRGAVNSQEYLYYINGIRRIVNFIYTEKFSGELAVLAACKVLFISACVLKNQQMPHITDVSSYFDAKIEDVRYKKLGILRKLDLSAYAYAVEAVRIINGNK